MKGVDICRAFVMSDGVPDVQVEECSRCSEVFFAVVSKRESRWETDRAQSLGNGEALRADPLLLHVRKSPF